MNWPFPERFTGECISEHHSWRHDARDGLAKRNPPQIETAKGVKRHL
jgi:hypothetical protein